jgi:hypothetical protein
MIIIGPGFLLLIFLCMFRPVRMVIGWVLFAVLCMFVYWCVAVPK